MLRLALEGRVSAARHHELYPFQTGVPGFIRYLMEVRCLREATVYHYSHHLNRIQDFLQRAGVGALRELSTVPLASFVVRSAPGMARTSRRDLCGALRVFLRFCFRERIIAEVLSAAVEMPQ